MVLLTYNRRVCNSKLEYLEPRESGENKIQTQKTLLPGSLKKSDKDGYLMKFS